MKAQDVMTSEVVTVRPETSIGQVAGIMAEKKISGLPVTDDEGRLVGIVTEGDLMRRSELGVRQASWTSPERRAREYVKNHSRETKDVMAADVITVEEGMPLGEIAAILEEAGIKRVPVMRDGELVGIVSRCDLLGAFAHSRPEPIAAGDEATLSAIIARVHNDARVRDGRLSVTVDNGLVHLWGALPSEAEREAVLVVTRNIRGVNGVVDHIWVDGKSRGHQPAKKAS